MIYTKEMLLASLGNVLKCDWLNKTDRQKSKSFKTFKTVSFLFCDRVIASCSVLGDCGD